jgi:hypothetical protein
MSVRRLSLGDRLFLRLIKIFFINNFLLQALEIVVSIITQSEFGNLKFEYLKIA